MRHVGGRLGDTHIACDALHVIGVVGIEGAQDETGGSELRLHGGVRIQRRWRGQGVILGQKPNRENAGQQTLQRSSP
ncbi:hypothetical protein D3C87_1910550 [compost metagenome]